MRFRLPAALAAAGLTAAITASVVVPPAANAADATLKDQLFADARATVVAMATRAADTDTQFLQDGRFRYTGTDCPRCELGPAVTAAALARRTGDAEMLGYTTTVFDAALRDQVKANGSFSAGLASEGGNLIQTVFFAEHLGATLYYLGDTLDPGRKAAYTTALTRAVDFLYAQGMLSWYTNGNINLAVTVATGMTARLTGVTKYQTWYENALAFTLAPPQNKWAGFGLQVTRAGTAPLGADTAAYLAEKGSGAPGYDPEYTIFQSEIASQGYQVIGDPRLLTLTSQLNNQLMARTSTTTWQVDIAKGSRHPYSVGTTTYFSPANVVLAAAGRTDLQASADAQLRNALPALRGWGAASWAGGYMSMGTTFAVDVFSAV